MQRECRQEAEKAKTSESASARPPSRGGDKYERFENWLREHGARFDQVSVFNEADLMLMLLSWN